MLGKGRGTHDASTMSLWVVTQFSNQDMIFYFMKLLLDANISNHFNA